MSASKLKHNSIDPSSTETPSTSAYTAYNAVDKLVAKPVFGSDGAKKWQSFAQEQRLNIQSNSVAPTAPLKAIDRATGFTSWKEEREYANQIRQSDDHNKNTTSSVYTNFTQKANHNDKNEITSKERKRIERRIIGENQEYFIPSPTFVGWKFDYIFTTRMETHGTGYYFDGMDSLKLLHGEISKDDIPPSAKVLSITPSEIDVATDKKRSTTTSSLNADEAAQPTKKKKKAKQLAPIIVNNPNHPLEQIAAILAQRQQLASSEILPLGWESAKGSATGKIYYFNRTTGERTWEPPPSVQPVANRVTSTTSAANDTNGNGNSSKSHDWNVAKDPTSGKEYYFNTQTGETSWEKPATTYTTGTAT